MGHHHRPAPRHRPPPTTSPTIPLAPQHLPHQPAYDDTERDAINAVNTTSALAIIGALPRDQAQAILLRVVVGLDTATTAQILDKRPGAIRTALHRGLRNLAKRLHPPTADAESDLGAANTATTRTTNTDRGLKEATCLTTPHIRIPTGSIPACRQQHTATPRPRTL